MKSGISLHGGYDHVAGWKRDKTNVTSITGVSEAVVGDTPDRETHIEFLTPCMARRALPVAKVDPCAAA